MRHLICIAVIVLVLVMLTGCPSRQKEDDTLIGPIVILQPPDPDPPNYLSDSLHWRRLEGGNVVSASYPESVFETLANGECEFRGDLMAGVVRFQARELGENKSLQDVQDVTLEGTRSNIKYRVTIVRSGSELSWTFWRDAGTEFECDAVAVSANPATLELPEELEVFQIKEARANGYTLENLEQVEIEFADD